MFSVVDVAVRFLLSLLFYIQTILLMIVWLCDVSSIVYEELYVVIMSNVYGSEAQKYCI